MGPIKRVLPVAALLALAACALPPAQAPALQSSAVRAIQVQKRMIDYTLHLPPRGRPSTYERARLKGFIAGVAEGRPDALHVAIRGATTKAALRRVKRMLIADGLDPAKMRLVPTGAHAVPGVPVTLEVVRYVAVPPPCLPWARPLSAKFDGSAPRASLGCSSLDNLAAMAADPRDLEHGSTSAFANGATAASAVNRYQEDKVTPLPRAAAISVLSGGQSGGGM